MDQQFAWCTIDETGKITGFGTATTDEIEALREAVEVLEGIPQPSRAELAYYKSEMEWYREHYFDSLRDAEAAREAVEVLEDRLEDEQFWYAAATDELRRYYEFEDSAFEAVEVLEDQVAQYRALFLDKMPDGRFRVVFSNEVFESAAREAVAVLEDMYEQRDAEAVRWFDKWKFEYEAHDADKRALRDAEATIEQLHEQNDKLGRKLSQVNDRLDAAEDAKIKAENSADHYARWNRNQARLLNRICRAAYDTFRHPTYVLDDVRKEIADCSDYE